MATINNIPKHKQEEHKSLEDQIKEYEEKNGPIETTPIEIRDEGDKASDRIKRYIGTTKVG